MSLTNRNRSSILDKPLSRGKGEISLSCFALLFSEVVQYCQNKSHTVPELQTRLHDLGRNVGSKLIDLYFVRERNGKREIKLLNILLFVKSTFWKALFGREADKLEHSNDDESTYYLMEKDPLVNRFISVPRDKGSLNCAVFIAGIIEAVLTGTGFTGALEGHHFRKTGTLEELSPQNLIDCTHAYSNQGCSGGYVDESFNYIKENGGINTLRSYPYEARDGPCRFDPSNIGANVTGFVEIPEGDELALATAIATQGPISAAIDASQSTFQFYSDGVYYDADCKSEADGLNHAILIVGYGVEADGMDYWLVKNSYGPEWGLGGYVKMPRNTNNHCGIATAAYYPLV